MTRPLVTQVSRFDPWKNPWEAIDSYRIAKKRFPTSSSHWLGVSASDDPEAPTVLSRFKNMPPATPTFTFTEIPPR